MPSWPPGSATLRRPSSLAEKPSMHQHSKWTSRRGQVNRVLNLPHEVGCGGRVGGVVAEPSPRRPERARLTHSVPHMAGSLRRSMCPGS